MSPLIGRRVLHDGQQGQALVLGLIVLFVALLAFKHFFASAQLVAARSKQTHALDAAAYSGALVQARALNLLAYLNRAQVGHQLAMAHLVTLASWARFGMTQATQLARGNPPAYLIAMLFGPAHGAAYLAAAQASGLLAAMAPLDELAIAYARHDHFVRSVFTTTQAQVVQSVAAARTQAMLEVLQANYQAPSSSLAQQASFDLSFENDTWPGFLQRHLGERQRSFTLETAGLYQFLAPRNHTAKHDWVVDPRCPGRRHELRRRGNTSLDIDGAWQGADTESFHALRSNRWIGCYFREYPMGWGWIPTAAARFTDEHVAEPPSNFSAQDFWRWVHEHTSWDIASGSGNPLANSWAVASATRWAGGGLPPYFDVVSNPAQALEFTAVLRHPGPDGLTVRTRTAAETYFQRPQPREDGRVEHPNLFRPYWQARLSPSLFSTMR